MSLGPVRTSYQPAINVYTADAYPSQTGATFPYVICPGARRLNLTVNHAPIFYRLGTRRGGAIVWDQERHALPSFQSLGRNFDAVQARSALRGQPALVTLDPLTRDELQ